MVNKNFAGKNGFIWWVGVIENRVDPMAVGRCQVRIFGWHPQEKNLLPTDKLPWAQAMQPLNNAKTASPPRIGEWVVGFFMDGELGQMPVMMGVLPGLHNPDITCKQNPAIPATLSSIVTGQDNPLATAGGMDFNQLSG
jgi:hypothetical protein